MSDSCDLCVNFISTDVMPQFEGKERPLTEDELPNGGVIAWMQVAGSFFLFFNSWGIVNTFGVFQTYYEIALAESQSPSNISWIGAIQAFLLLVMGVVTGPLYDAGYFQSLIISGSLLIVLGFMMTSICTKYWEILLAQALCIGVGSSCLFIPSVAIIPQYFSSRKGLATGLAASGSSFGGVVYPILFRRLQPQIGFGWATRTLGLIALVSCAFSVSVMRARQMPRQRRSLMELEAFREAPYSLFCVAMFFGYVGFFGPIFYVQSYAIHTKAMGENLAFYLLPILNAASVPGRIIPGFFAGKFGPINILLPAATITGALTFCWIGIHSAAGLVSFSILYGFFSGAFVSLPSVALTSLTPDLRRLGTRMGMCSVICSFGSLCGTPVSGAILSSTGQYLGVQLFSGATIVITGLLLCIARLSKVGKKLRMEV